MASADAATRHVVDRCPSCGVEHEVRAPACEACDTPLRPWCRVHGREIGWLDGPTCRRCTQEAADRAPSPRPRPHRPRPPAAPAGVPARPPSRSASPRLAMARTAGRRTALLVADEPLLRLGLRALKPVAVTTVICVVLGFAFGFALEGKVTQVAGVAAIVFGLAGLAFGGALGWAIVVDARSLRPRMTRSASRGLWR